MAHIILAYILYLVVPGFLLLLLLRRQRNIFVHSVSLSLCFLVFSQIPFRVYQLPFSAWALTYHVSIVMLLSAIVFREISARRSGASANLLPVVLRRHFVSRNVAFLLLIFVYGVYHFYAGPYTEIPSDFWSHMVRTEWEYQAIENNRYSYYGALPLGFVNRDFTHSVHALIAHHFGVHPRLLVAPATFATSLLFLCSIYWFSFVIFNRLCSQKLHSIVLALLSVLLTLLWMGISVFSYVRYYAYAPSILNYILLLSYVVLLVEFLRRRTSWFWTPVLFPALLVAMAFIHLQEVLFAFVLSVALVVNSIFLTKEKFSWQSTNLRTRSTLALIVAFFAVAIVGVHASTKELTGSFAGAEIQDVGNILPFFKNLYIVNLKGRVYEAVGVFGLIIYVLFLTNRRVYRGNLFINSSMYLPFFTIFNPLFVYVFLHYGTKETLWRFCYILPIGFVAAHQSFVLLRRVLSRADLRSKTVSLALLFVLGASLLPLNSHYYSNMYSRLFTLKRHDVNESLYWIDDLIRVLEEQPSTHIITDPVTSYVLNATTNHIVPGHKFYRNTSGYDFPDLIRSKGIQWLQTIEAGVMIINMRDGSLSVTGAISQHWPEDVRTVSKWYPAEMISYVKGHPERFAPIFEKDRVFAYRIAGSN